MKDKIGDIFQQETKYIRGKLGGKGLDWSAKPEQYKTYPKAKRIKFPEPNTDSGSPIWGIIKNRRSIRSYLSTPLSINELSQLLWASQGLTLKEGPFAFRAAPSAGALYPIETYLVINAVNSVEPGVYHYSVQDHELEQLTLGNHGQAAAHAALDQFMVAEANVTFIWTAIFERCRWKYEQRAFRYVYLDAGHIAAHVSLAATGMGLGTCQIAALYDDEINALIGVDGIEESVLYMTVVGHPS